MEGYGKCLGVIPQGVHSIGPLGAFRFRQCAERKKLSGKVVNVTLQDGVILPFSFLTVFDLACLPSASFEGSDWHFDGFGTAGRQYTAND